MMKTAKSNGLARTLKRIFSNKLVCVGTFIIIVWILLGLFSTFIASFDPLEVNTPERLQSPNTTHIMGTDNYGRDIFSRVISGAKISLGLGVISVAISLTSGMIIGSFAGFHGGRAGNLIMRFMDILQSFPSFVLIISISVAMGRTIGSAMLAIGIANTPQFARQMYAQTSRLRESLLVESLRALGISDTKILFKHVIPNSLSVIIVQAAFNLGSSILSLAALSFIGLGVSPPTPEWGAMISDARGYILTGEWWMFTFPGVAMATLILAFNLLGDGLRDVLDPRTK